MDPRSTRSFGNSDVRATVLGLGGGPLGDLYDVLHPHGARQAIETAYERGIGFYDTAPFYGHGLSEHRFGSVLNRKPRGSFSLSTKVGRYLVPPDAEHPLDWTPFVGGLEFNHVFDYTREGTQRSLEQSFARLGLSRVDCVVIHNVDIKSHGSREAYEARFKETMAGCYPYLDELRTRRVIGAIGIGTSETYSCMDFAAAGDFDFFLLANRYTLLDQSALDDFLPMCQARNAGVSLGGPYNTGILATGAVDGARYNNQPANREILDRVRRIEAVCGRHGVPLRAAALQFPLGHSSVTTVIPGAVSSAEVEQNIALMEVEIPADLWAELKQGKLLNEDAPTPA